MISVLFVVLYKETPLTQQPTSPPPAPWRISIGNFTTNLAADDGRVFTISRDTEGGIKCYNASNGDLIWRSGDSYFTNGLAVTGGGVFGGTVYGEVLGVNEASGEFMFNCNVGYLESRKSGPDSLAGANGKVFVTFNSFSACNASNGDLLWTYPMTSHYGGEPYNYSKPVNVYAWPVEGDRLLATGTIITWNQTAITWSGITSANYIFRLDPDSGEILWKAPGDNICTSIYVSPAVYQGQVIGWNSTNAGQTTLFSLNESTGALLWTSQINASIYQPTAQNGLVLFGASDGNFYGLRMKDGTKAWQTHVDTQNLIPTSSPENLLLTSQIQVDGKLNNVIWSFAVSQPYVNKTQNQHCQGYNGTVCNLDLLTGSLRWAKPIEMNESATTDKFGLIAPVLGLAQAGGNVYVTTSKWDWSNDLWTLNETTGTVLRTEHFEHYIVPPVKLGDRVFVAGDLYLMSFS
jgi:outer membrane protein assembly factor BamB